MSLILINTRHVGYQMKALDVRNPINTLILHFWLSGYHTHRPRPLLACQASLFSHRFTSYIHVGYQTKFPCDYNNNSHKNIIIMQNEGALCYHGVRGLYFVAVIFAATIDVLGELCVKIAPYDKLKIFVYCNSMKDQLYFTQKKLSRLIIIECAGYIFWQLFLRWL